MIILLDVLIEQFLDQTLSTPTIHRMSNHNPAAFWGEDGDEEESVAALPANAAEHIPEKDERAAGVTDQTFAVHAEAMQRAVHVITSQRHAISELLKLLQTKARLEADVRHQSGDETELDRRLEALHFGERSD